MNTIIFTAALVTQVLGAAQPESSVRVPRAERPVTNSVQFFDNMREDMVGESLTNAVLRRATREASVRAWTNQQTGEINERAARRMLAAHQEHCAVRLDVDKFANPKGECGPGFSR